jgi:cytochrome c553
MTIRALARNPLPAPRLAGRIFAAAVLALLALMAAPCNAQAPQGAPRGASPPAATAPPAAGPVDVSGIIHVCSSCHGPGGRSVSSTFPRLAAQQKEYLVAQLRAFRDHTRADPHAKTYMWGMAARLTDAVIEGIADYYSRQPAVPGTPDASALAAAGRRIFTEGIPSQSVPACKACHGDHAEGNAVIPRLAGQHRAYIEVQLAAFASKARTNDVMHENTKNLTAAQISAVAAYVETQ